MPRLHLCLCLILCLLFVDAASSQVRVEIDNRKTYQAIDGFGATTGSLVYNSDNLTPALRAKAIDAVYSRVRLTMGNVAFGVFETPRNATDTWGQRANDDDDPFHYEWRGFNWTALGAMNQKLLSPARPLGFDRFYPANSISLRWEQTWLGAFLASDYRRFLDECGEHVLAGLRYWRDTLSLPASRMMLFNEPTSGNGELAGGSIQTVVDVIKAVGARLAAEGFGEVRFVVPGEETEQRSLDVATAILADPEARSFVGAIAYHTYPYGSIYSSVPNILATSGMGKPDAGRIAVRASLKSLGARYGIPLWMTEVSHGGIDPRSMDALRGRAIHIHDEMVYAGASAYFGMQNMWDKISQQMHFGNSNLYSNEGTIALIDNDSSLVTITGMGYAIGHYARWIGAGARRIDASSDDSLVQATAFRDSAAGRISLVLINNASAGKTVAVHLAGASFAADPGGEQSYGEERWKPLTGLALSSSSGFDLYLPPQSVTSCTASFAPLTNVPADNRPRDFRLDITPSPISSSAIIRFSLPAAGRAAIILYDLFGRKVMTILDAETPSAGNEILFNALHLRPGLYFCRLQMNGGGIIRSLRVVR